MRWTEVEPKIRAALSDGPVLPLEIEPYLDFENDTFVIKHPDGGYATISLKVRGWSPGMGRVQKKSTGPRSRGGKYTGRGWIEDLARDAWEDLRSIMES